MIEKKGIMGCVPSVPENEQMYTLDQIKNSAETGDIILFSGHGPISSCVRLFSHSVWSHVALIYRDNDGRVFIWECSQDDKLHDNISGIKKRGARLVLWEEMFGGGYDGFFIALRKLRWNTELEALNKEVAELKDRWQHDEFIGLRALFRSMIDIEYCSDLLPLVGSTMLSSHDHPGSLREQFCTQLTITTLRAMDIAKNGSPICQPQYDGYGRPSYKYKLDYFTSDYGNGVDALDLFGWGIYSKEYYALIPRK